MSDKDDYMLAFLEQWRDELTSHDGDREDFEKAIAIQKAQTRLIESARQLVEYVEFHKRFIPVRMDSPNTGSLDATKEALAALDEVKK